MTDKIQFRDFLTAVGRVFGAVLRLKNLTALGFVATLGTVLGFLGAWNWFLDLFAHFRVQYFWGLLVIGVLILFERKRAWAFTFLIMSAVNLVLILPFYLGKPKPHNYDTAPLRVMLINVHIHNDSHQKVLDCIRAYNPDFIVLEEIGGEWFRAITTALSNDYPHVAKELRDDPFGIGLWSKHPFASTNIFYSSDFALPSILAGLDTPHGSCSILATHPLPPIGSIYSENRNAQLAELAQRVRGSPPLLLIGDLNATPWCAAFKRFLRDSGLKNSAQGRGAHPTWPAPFPPFLRIPIDHVLHTPDVEIISRQTGPRVGSDHRPVIVDFKLPPPSREINHTLP